MTTQLLAQLWQFNQAAASGPVRKLTPDNFRHRLTPETASAGFMALHTAEVMHRFAFMLFGREVSRMQLLTFLMHHNSYHAGQIAQATKKGQPLVTAEPV